jgi:hypothetical protein
MFPVTFSSGRHSGCVNPSNIPKSVMAIPESRRGKDHPLSLVISCCLALILELINLLHEDS